MNTFLKTSFAVSLVFLSFSNNRVIACTDAYYICANSSHKAVEMTRDVYPQGGDYGRTYDVQKAWVAPRTMKCVAKDFKCFPQETEAQLVATGCQGAQIYRGDDNLNLFGPYPADSIMIIGNGKNNGCGAENIYPHISDTQVLRNWDSSIPSGN